jgi:galactose mutarotase-like enzyme
MAILENDHLLAKFKTKGAELQSLINKKTGIEYMWVGDPAFWGKYSPVLFPVVGGLKDDTYFYKNKAYHLPRHGFARDQEFELTQISDAEIVFTLNHSEATLLVYPFPFRLQLRYTIDSNVLTCRYEVYNPGKDILLFSVGAHPAFAVPMLNDLEDYKTYYLQFNVAETLYRWKLHNGLIAEHSALLPTENGRLQLEPELFYEDAIVLKGLQSNRITIGCDTHPHRLNFNFNGFDYFGIWAAKDAPFVCLEPWCGIADSVNSNQQLTNKEGINILQPDEEWSRAWSVESY